MIDNEILTIRVMGGPSSGKSTIYRILQSHGYDVVFISQTSLLEQAFVSLNPLQGRVPINPPAEESSHQNSEPAESTGSGEEGQAP